MRDNIIVIKYAYLTILIFAIIFINSNVLCAQDTKSIKTIVKTTVKTNDKTTDFITILSVYTMHGDFYLPSLYKQGIKNKNYPKYEKTILESEKLGKQILIKYHQGGKYDGEIVDVIPVK